MRDSPEHGAAYQAPFTAALLHPRHWPSWLGLGLLAVLSLLPRRVLRLLAVPVAAMLWHTGQRRRQIALVNLRLCFPELDETARLQLLKRHLRGSAHCLLDYPRLWFRGTHPPTPPLQIHGLEHLQRCQQAAQPVILLAAHTAALDFAGLELGRVLGQGCSMAKPLKNPVAEWINHRSRTRYGAQIFSRAQGLRPVVRRLRAAGVFYYLPDEDLGPRHAVFAPFFGIPKATLSALGGLASMTGAAVLPCITTYDTEHDQYHVWISPPLQDFPTGDKLADAQRMNAALEQLIRQHPEHYLWSFRWFKTRPDPKDNFYF
ncbi:lipid A biosynthesis acyltransferase [Thiorhodospira sibirica]|uniref:LpxL/LpxP family acyltransferase n=1 Tax=Thiorhodospira sibirica TaxID=154347 RepID=UPI00022C4676|nr:lipid A biosynthesis acyltransferase [Thiorhodospira sibirica]